MFFLIAYYLFLYIGLQFLGTVFTVQLRFNGQVLCVFLHCLQPLKEISVLAIQYPCYLAMLLRSIINVMFLGENAYSTYI